MRGQRASGAALRSFPHLVARVGEERNILTLKAVIWMLRVISLSF